MAGGAYAGDAIAKGLITLALTRGAAIGQGLHVPTETRPRKGFLPAGSFLSSPASKDGGFQKGRL
jgi:hypothetical protein